MPIRTDSLLTEGKKTAAPSASYHTTVSPLVTEADRCQQDAAPPGACRTLPNGAAWGMADASNPFRPRTRDTKVMFAVTYGDGRTAYIRVDPERRGMVT